MSAVSLELRVLGTLTVLQDGHPIELPPSRKARALLAYLALSPRTVTRSRLCLLLFDDANDPRAELRWCLSKLRGVVGARIDTSAESAHLNLTECFVDALEVQRACRPGITTLASRRARELLTLFSGDFLEGLEIDRCPEFTGWLLAQRRCFRRWRVALLEHLAESAAESESLSDIEQWLQLAPFDIHAHQHFLGALARGSRYREGEEHLVASIKSFNAQGADVAPLRKVWRELMVRRSSAIAVKCTSSTDEHARDYYMQGRQHLARMMKSGLDASRDMFVRAIELDPDYGPAWAGLSVVHACLYEWFGAEKLRLAGAEQTSRRALELGPRLADVHVARGLARSLSRHYDEAVTEFEMATRIDPYLFDAYYYHARTAFARGDMSRAAEMFHLASELRPQDFQSPMLFATAAHALGRDDSGREAARIGIRRAEQVLALDPQDGRALSLGAGALLEDDQTERALEWSKRALELYPDDTSAMVNVACVYARTGQSSEALGLLERVFAQGCGKRDWIENDPDYRLLRNEPRFHRLLSMLK
jgi:DNA-binding SARP family transcriptional activator/cytochrome c-type biogenesis protein CcmH/NrfG